MEPQDKEHDQQQGADSASKGEHNTEQKAPTAGPQVIRTDDPVLTPAQKYNPDWINHPDRNMSIETSKIRASTEAFNPNYILVPIESDRPAQGQNGHARQGESGAKEDKKGGNGNGDQKGGKGQGEKDQSEAKKDDQEKSGDQKDAKQGQSSKAPSLTRTLIYAGVVALVCGIIGAAGYSYFFGSDKGKSGDKSSGSSKKSGSSKGSDSKDDSDKDEESDTSKKKEEEEADKLLQAQAAWTMAVKELHKAHDSEQSARHSAEDTKSILDFLKKTLLSAGRPGDVSLADAFWAGGQGKDITLRKAVDLADTQVTEAFAERPVAEASVREMLGQAYLNLGEASQAVKEFERALELREAMQGMGDPDTASCRNQLAVAYRLADRAGEGGRLFDRNTDSPAHASTLAVRGAMLLIQKKPSEAELKLRQSLAIRQKTQPGDWTTFDTKSMLGEAILDQNKFAEAEPLLVSGYEGMKEHKEAIPTQDKPRVTKALQRLIKLYETWGKNAEAMRWRKELEMVQPPLK